MPLSSGTGILSPRGFVHPWNKKPTAYAVGCIPPPLCGFCWPDIPKDASYRSDVGSDRFFGDALVSSASSKWAEAGIPAFPSRRISFADSLRP